jgi:hypothetical protein
MSLTPETLEPLTPEQKYSKDGPFMEPVLRCDGCQALVLRTALKRIGMCPECSNTRMRNVRTMSPREQQQAQQWAEVGTIDPDWLKLFEASDEA